MNRITLSTVKNALINIAVILTILIGIDSILIGYYHQLKIGNYYGFIGPGTLQLHRTLSVIMGFGLIFISYRLFKRMRMAWIISICILSISAFMHILKAWSIFKPTTIVQMIVIIILLINYKSFKIASDPLSIRNGIILGLIVAAIIALNTCFTIYVLKIKTSTVNGMYNAVSNALKMLFLLDPSVLGNVSKTEIVFAKSEIVINWVGIIVYVVASGVAVCAGDPICSEENMPLLVTEFITYCKQNNLDICFCQTLEKNIPLYTQLRFGYTKYGEEAMFDLETYTLADYLNLYMKNLIISMVLSRYITIRKNMDVPYGNQDTLYIIQRFLHLKLPIQ